MQPLCRSLLSPTDTELMHYQLRLFLMLRTLGFQVSLRPLRQLTC